MAKVSPEDQNLAPSQYPDLNRQFFAASRGPHQFIHHRLRGIVLAASNDDLVIDALNQGLSIGKMKMTGVINPDSMSDEDMVHFAALEAVVLFNHAAETLLRLVLSMENHAPCPWLELARLKRPREFANRTAKLVDALNLQDGKDFIASVLYGRSSAPPGISQTDWDDYVDGAVGLIRECATRHSDESAVYNSAKHGLSTIQGRAVTQLRSAESEPMLVSPELPSLTVLEATNKTVDKRRKWHMTTRWIEADRTLTLVFLIARQIENLWSVARFRYVDRNEERYPHLLSATILTKALRGPIGDPGYRIALNSFSVSLQYLRK